MAAGGISDESLAAIKVVFFEECPEHLAELEVGLQALQGGATDPEIVNTIFRAVHSIKGGASIFDLPVLVQFAHTFESALAKVRASAILPDPADIKVLLKAADVLADLVGAAKESREVDPSRTAAIDQELKRLFADAEAAPSNADEDEDEDELDAFAALGVAPRPVDFDALQVGGEARSLAITFRPYAGLYAKANEPLYLIRELGRLGELDVVLNDGDIPPLDELELAESYLSWTMQLRTEHNAAEVREVFEFVEDDCDLAVAPGGDGAVAPASAAPATDLPEIDQAAPAAAPVPVAPVAATPGVESAAPQAASQTIRVDLERVDRLIDLVSELVINQAMLAQRLADKHIARHSDVSMALEDLDHLTRDLQDSVMAIRAQPVKAVFQRMSRLVREVEAATGKSVRLLTEGENTEVDRTVIERLSDPLTHMLRNAIDHGIETPQDRLAAGKPAEGVLRISAAHRAGRIIIEVADDGVGIDRQRVRDIAVKRGVIAGDAALSDEEVDDLIFAPGFSTAAVVSDLSGRGVGMDVVRSSVQALGGRISVASVRGQGTTFTLSLPLTLAVLDGMLVTARGQNLIAPLTTLIESFQVKPGDIQRLGPRAGFLTIRGEHIPLIALGEALGYASGAATGLRSMAILVEDDTGQRAALLVDDILGQRQVVIKSLEANYRHTPGIAAATILGDGRVALILDINGILSSQRRVSAAARQTEAA